MKQRASAFAWRRYPEAERWLAERMDRFASAMPAVRRLDAELLAETGTRLPDWLDHLIIRDGDRPRGQLGDLGFAQESVPAPPGDSVYSHGGAAFPRLVLRDAGPGAPGQILGAAIQVEEIQTFLAAHNIVAAIEGSVLSPYRRCRVWDRHGLEFWLVERRGHAGLVPVECAPDYADRYVRAYERWATRPRIFADNGRGMEETLSLARKQVREMGVDLAAWIAFSAERDHWARRNRAGQVQKARQDRTGVGWANHDHHTFRSSRSAFRLLIQILETLGFRPRERFYAGIEAGWGAQVMEQPACRLAVFADVDLLPEEVTGDFAHDTLSPHRSLGTVGLWCALHGESMLGAGLHHVAARCDSDAAAEGLAEWGIKTMRPFSDFTYLRQAFTQGQRWTVASDRLRPLLTSGDITPEQWKQFSEKGAVGSHLEIIERGDGFKGFSQQTISDIIRRTDPRVAEKEDA